MLQTVKGFYNKGKIELEENMNLVGRTFLTGLIV